MVMLRVRIIREDVHEFGSIRARLLGGPLDLTNDGFVMIELPEEAVGTNCIDLGPTDAPVFVVGRLRQPAPGDLVLVATPTQTWPIGARRARHDLGDYDQHVIEPAYRRSRPAPPASSQDKP